MTDETTFYRRSEEWLSRILEFSPIAATQMGDHQELLEQLGYIAQPIQRLGC